MKTRLTLTCIIAFFALSIFSSCEKVKDLIKVNVPLQTAEVSFSIDQQPAGTQSLAGFHVVINIDSILKASNSKLSISNIKSVKINSCTITALNASANAHFGNEYLSACQFYITSNGGSNAGSATKIAELTSNPQSYATSLALPVNSDLELKEYFSGSMIYYQLSGTVAKPTTSTLNCTATVKFDIEAGL